MYDGHGGPEVALYCAKYLPEFLKKLEDYTSGNLEEALKNLFLKFDESLLTPEALNELKELRDSSSRKSSVKGENEENGHVSGNSENEEEPEYENEAAQLCDEATMPLEEVLKRYSRTEKKMKRSLKKKGLIRASSSLEEKPATFQEQEERDMDEIKKNSNVDQENGAHDHEYDEASNLGEISDSQKSGLICESSSLQMSENSMTKSALPGNDTKKLNKEEIKLSPIRKKSSSLVIDDVSSITSDNTVLNGSNGQAGSSNEENKENDFEKGSSNETETNGDLKTEKETEKRIKTGKKSSSTNLIAKLIAGVVNSKLKQGLKNSKASKDKGDANNDEGEEDDEDDDYDEEDDDEEEEEEEEDEEESDDEDEENDYEEEDEDDDEDDDDEIDIDAAQSFSLDSRPGYDSGCTAVVALLKETKLYVANAGDSRCVVCRDGKAIEMSFDHKPEDDIERQRIEKAGGTVTKDGRVNAGLKLSRAIGDHTYKANKTLSLSEQMITPLPDLKVLDIDPNKDKFMVLACDGIWNFMSSQEVCDYIQERLNANYAKLSLICEEMFMHCLAPDAEGDGTGCDNMTCIIVTFNPFRKIVVKIENGDSEKNNLKRTHQEEGERTKIDSNQAETKKLKQESE